MTMARHEQLSKLILPDRYREEQRNHTIKLPQGQLGDAYGGGAFGGNNLDQLLYFMQMPGGGMLMFDLSKLTLQDYRQMRDHYQVTVSLWILEFMLNQLDWSIECDREDIRTKVEENLKEHWPKLIHAMATAFWAGYSPNILQFDNNTTSDKLPSVRLDKIKDLMPEYTQVNWKQVEGFNPQGPNSSAPKIDIFDGMKLRGQSFPVPVTNSYWYPFLMENGNMMGRKLLRPAFPPYFFSQLLHLFANRYFERYGEPVPIGRYPDEDTVIDEQGTTVPARTVMEGVLSKLRNRSVVTLPSNRDGNFYDKAGGANAFEWDIEYLESQMRGADFERYMLRLDEEVSLALFTPVLMYRTTDVGSYNLGEQHYRLFMVMLNSIAGDMKLHIDKYILDRIVDMNWGVNAPRARWTPRRLGRDSQQLVQAVAQAVVSGAFGIPDLEELSIATGIEFHKPSAGDMPPASKEAKLQADTQQTLADKSAETAVTVAKQRVTAPAGGQKDRAGNNRPSGSSRRAGSASLNQLADQMFERVLPQIRNGNFTLDLGYEKQLRQLVGAEEAAKFRDAFDTWFDEERSVGATTAEMNDSVGRCLHRALEALGE